jgi:hypothetical protein
MNLVFKKCVAYPQENFLFTILYGDSPRPPTMYIEYLKSAKNKDTYIIGTPIKTKIFLKKLFSVP